MSRLTFTLLVLLSLPMRVGAQSDTLRLTLPQAMEIADARNLSLSIAREGVNAARAEERELNALWFPTVALSGEWSHSLTEIAAVTSIGEIAGEAAMSQVEELLKSIAPPLAGVVGEVAAHQVRLPLVPRTTASVGMEVVWTIFSGGRRIQASRISEALLQLAANRLQASENALCAGVVEAYFGVRLAEASREVCAQSVVSFCRHLRQARLMEAEGVIVPSERMVAEVALEQARARLKSAEGELRVAQHTLLAILDLDSLILSPTTPLFLPKSLPSKAHFDSLLLHSPLLGALRQQSQIATHSLRMEQSRYLPSVALIGHQQLWSSGLASNLFPRTFVGVGLSWTLFDGLSREGAVARSRSAVRSSEGEYQRVLHDLHLSVDRLYAALTTAQSEYTVGVTTESLVEELLRSRQRAFAEGMATSSEVIDAQVMLSEVKLGKMAALYAIDSSLCSLLMLIGQADQYADYISNNCE